MAKFSPAFILVAPQMGENIGAAARAMLNFGIRDLRIVAPRDGWPNKAATDNAAGALDEMSVNVFKTLEDAAADLHYLFAATARPRYISKPVFTANEAASEYLKRAGRKQKAGFVFGPERTGLTNDDIALCNGILTIPSNPASPCLNLAQSVSVTGYEIFTAKKIKAKPGIKKKQSPPAPHEKINGALSRLEEELEKNGFFEAENLKPVMKRNIRAMMMRAEWSEQETRTFHGVITALTGRKKRKEKAAR